MPKAVFLDRDGTIIEYHEVVSNPAHIRLLPGAAEGIARLKRAGYRVVVITNQPAIEKGILTLAQSDKLNKVLEKKLREKGAAIDAFYTCPHKYPSDCPCRKPAVGMIEEAQKKFDINLSGSFVVGDSTRDIQAGINAGVRTVLVKTGMAGEGPDRQFFDVKPDFVADDLLSAARLICGSSQR